jgi:hypothetical protein
MGVLVRKRISRKQYANDDTDVHTLAISSCTEKSEEKYADDSTGKNSIDGKDDTEHTFIAREQIQCTDGDSKQTRDNNKCFTGVEILFIVFAGDVTFYNIFYTDCSE